MEAASENNGPRRLAARIVERARRRLRERGVDPDDAFPARWVRDLVPAPGGRRMCLEAIYRAIARGHLEAVRIGREWFCDLEGFVHWLGRRAGTHGGDIAGAAAEPEADAMHAAVDRRLNRRRASRRA